MVSTALRNIEMPWPAFGRLGNDLRKRPDQGWLDWLFTAGTSVGTIFSLVWVAVFAVAALFDFDYAVQARDFITEYTVSGAYFPLVGGELQVAPLITWASLFAMMFILVGKFRLLQKGVELPQSRVQMMNDAGTITIYQLFAVLFYNMMIEDVELYILPAIVFVVMFYALVTIVDVMKTR